MNNILLDLQIEQAAKIIKTGAIVAFPTDTFYGLACDPFNANSVERLYQIKKRSGNKAILLLVSSQAMLDRCVDWEKMSKEAMQYFELLAKNFWPGPLTIVFPALSTLPKNLVSENQTIGIRYPKYDIAQKFTQAAGGIITATSANLSGQANAETAQEVFSQLGNTLDYILDAGSSPGGKASTLIDLSCNPPKIIREGAIETKDIQLVLGNNLITS